MQFIPVDVLYTFSTQFCSSFAFHQTEFEMSAKRQKLQITTKVKLVAAPLGGKYLSSLRLSRPSSQLSDIRSGVHSVNFLLPPGPYSQGWLSGISQTAVVGDGWVMH